MLGIGNDINTEARSTDASRDLKEVHKIYGVTFDSNYRGSRAGNAIGLVWEPSSNTKQNTDDFIELTDSPFNLRKCNLTWNSSTGKFDIDSIPSLNSITCIEFPKFYYYNPNNTSMFVSSTCAGEDYIPSKMHYRQTGVDEESGDPIYTMEDYVYIAQSNIYSSDNIYYPLTGKTIDEFREIAKDNHCYLFDYACYESITMLATIKYANLNFTISNGLGNHSDAIISQYDNIKGMDGYYGKNIYSGSNIKCMGLLDLYGNTWEFLDGIIVYRNSETKENISYYSNYLDNNISNYTTLDQYIEKGYYQIDDQCKSWTLSHPFDWITYNSPRSQYNFYVSPDGKDSNPPYQYSGTVNNIGKIMNCVVGGYVWTKYNDDIYKYYAYNEYGKSHDKISARFFIPGSLVNR